MFDESSRYKDAPVETVEDARGREVRAVTPQDTPNRRLAGYHRRQQAQRLDHLAHRYLGDATAYWKICEINDVMHPDQLAERSMIAIPTKEG